MTETEAMTRGGTRDACQRCGEPSRDVPAVCGPGAQWAKAELTPPTGPAKPWAALQSSRKRVGVRLRDRRGRHTTRAGLDLGADAHRPVGRRPGAELLVAARVRAGRAGAGVRDGGVRRGKPDDPRPERDVRGAHRRRQDGPVRRRLAGDGIGSSDPDLAARCSSTSTAYDWLEEDELISAPARTRPADRRPTQLPTTGWDDGQVLAESTPAGSAVREGVPMPRYYCRARTSWRARTGRPRHDLCLQGPRHPLRRARRRRGCCRHGVDYEQPLDDAGAVADGAPTGSGSTLAGRRAGRPDAHAVVELILPA